MRKREDAPGVARADRRGAAALTASMLAAIGLLIGADSAMASSNPMPVSAPLGVSLGGIFDACKAWISGPGFDAARRVGLGVLIFVGGWAVMRLVCAALLWQLRRMRWLARLIEGLKIEVLLGEDAPPHVVERMLTQVVFYVGMLFVLVAALDQADMHGATEPLKGMLGQLAAALPAVGKAILILLAAFVAGRILETIVTRGLDAVKIDLSFARLSVPERPDESPDAVRGIPAIQLFSRTAGRVVFWLVIVIGLTGALEVMGLGVVAASLRGVMSTVIGYLPILAMSALIILAGYVGGKILAFVVSGLLEAVGFDRWIARQKLDHIFGARKPSERVGAIALVTILMMAVVQALHSLGLDKLSRPLDSIIDRGSEVLPALLISGVIIALGAVIGGRLGGLLEGLLRGVGLSRRLSDLGLPQERVALLQPERLLGRALHAVIVLLAVAQALDNLALGAWSVFIAQLLDFLFTRGFVAGLIVALGLIAAAQLRRVLSASVDAGHTSPLIAALIRHAVLVFAAVMAMQQLGVAEEFVLVTFAIILASVCLSAALGARELLGEIIRQQYQRVANGPTPPPPGSSSTGGGAPPPGAPPGAPTIASGHLPQPVGSLGTSGAQGSPPSSGGVSGLPTIVLNDSVPERSLSQSLDQTMVLSDSVPAHVSSQPLDQTMVLSDSVPGDSASQRPTIVLPEIATPEFSLTPSLGSAKPTMVLDSAAEFEAPTGADSDLLSGAVAPPDASPSRLLLNSTAAFLEPAPTPDLSPPHRLLSTTEALLDPVEPQVRGTSSKEDDEGEV